MLFLQSVSGWLSGTRGCLKNAMGRGSSFNGMVVGQPRKIGGFASTRHGGTTDTSWDVIGDSQQVSAMDQKL